MMRLLLTLSVTFGLLSACTKEQVIVEMVAVDPATSLVVLDPITMTELNTAAQTKWLRAVAYDTADNPVQSWTASVGPGADITFANRIILEPEGNDASRGWGVSVEIFDSQDVPADDDEGFARQQAFGRYLTDQTLVVELRLDPSCPRCEDGQACFRGSCVGACIDENADPGVPVCGECEVCALGGCVPQPDGAPCGCAGDTCQSGVCQIAKPVRELATGRYSTCITVEETLFCTGENGSQRLGISGPDLLLSHTEAGSFAGGRFRALALGGAATGDGPPSGPAMGCVIAQGPELSCFGGANPALGLPGRALRLAFPTVPDPENVAVGASHMCVLTSGGQLWCAGSDGRDQLGNGSGGAVPHSTPYLVPPPEGSTKWLDVDAGHVHTCAIDDVHRVWCWGNNQNGEVGTSDTANRDTPFNVPLIGEAALIELGEFHSCALMEDGTAQCWGGSSFGNTGRGAELQDAPPGEVLAPEPLRQIACGRSHCCALARDSRALYCWGANASGRLGQSVADRARLSPERVDIDADWSQVRAGEDHTCAIRTGGALFCWGGNAFGQLGLGHQIDHFYPTRVCL